MNFCQIVISMTIQKLAHGMRNLMLLKSNSSSLHLYGLTLSNVTIKVIILCLSLNSICHAKTVNYDLTIDFKKTHFKGIETQGMSVNGTIPAPTLYFQEGDTAHIQIRNNMDVNTSVHWHGILLPNHQDGVPYVNHPPIAPGETHLFQFKIRQAGTYWYHSHTGLQEQSGVYGAIVILPKQKSQVQFDIEETVVLSDWINENPDQVLRTLKSGNDFYSIKKGSQQNLLSAIQKGGVRQSIKQSLHRMPAMDIADVAYDLFLANGKPETIIPAKAGNIVKLRLVNAAASTYFSLHFAKADMQIIAADGIDVRPLTINNFLMAVAETYTLLIKVPEHGLFELRATAQDGSGYSSIWIGSGKRIAAADVEKPNPYQTHMAKPVGTKNSTHHGMHHGMQQAMKNQRPNKQAANTPYEKLKALTITTLPVDNKMREIQLDLTGDMERYIWSINNEILAEDNTIKIRKGENIRFVLNNKTMMHHPMHLHGHFFRVINGQGEYSPLKHTVDVPPMGKKIIEFEANESQDWFFHCHNLYHAKSGMARIVSYQEDKIDQELADIRHKLFSDEGFFYASGSLLSQMSDGMAVYSNSKYSLQTEWQIGWQNVTPVEYEINLTVERYFNRFFSAFTGGRFENGIERGIFGFRYVLPLNFESEWRVDTSGELRITLGNSLQLTSNINLFADFEYDTESKQEWGAGINYLLTKNFGLVAQYHSDFGMGAGFKLVY